MTMSPAALMDRKTMKQHANGISLSHFSPLHPPSCHSSESPPDTYQPSLDLNDSTPYFSMDDAHVYEAKAKILPPQATSFHARQLLDPKGFSQPPQDQNLQKENQILKPMSPLSTVSNGSSHSSVGEKTSRRDDDEFEGQGMGNFIERIHNVAQAERRPAKKQKMDRSEDLEGDAPKAKFGGGKGGDLGEFVKQKHKEGLEQAGSKPIVDLTEGKSESGAYHCLIDTYR